jgi:serine protease inhibitor
VPAEFSAKTTSFAFDFWKSYEKEKGAEGSYFLSPLSLNMALGMLMNGAEGETQSEIRQMLGFQQSDMASVNQYYIELLEKLPKVDPKVKNLLANSVWHDKEFAVEKAYLDLLKKDFSAEVYGEDFSQASTVNKINAWAAKHTENKIQKVLDEIRADQVLFLMNALYFKGDWTKTFDPKNTVKDTFYGVQGKREEEFMNIKDNFPYADMDGFEAVELPYGNEKYGLVVMLPKGDSVEDMILGLDELKWNATLAALSPQKVQLSLPKMKMETSTELISVLQNMGMKKAFTDGAELGGISKGAKLVVGLVKQDTYVAMDEKGTEAAAVTTIGVELTSIPQYPVIRCDRPFAFAIVEKTSNTIQFIGKLN